jgi:HEAT repeat protein
MPDDVLLFATRLSRLNSPEDARTREDLILAGLKAQDPATRQAAIAWAARYLEPRTLVRLVGRHDDATLRNSALASLERQGPYALGQVEEMLRDPDPDVAMFGCQVLGQIGTESNGAALIPILHHPKMNVAQAAVEALGSLRVKAATPFLLELLKGGPWLQLAAIDALGTLGDPRAVGPLLGLVTDPLLGAAAVAALARLGAPEALPSLTAFVLDADISELRPMIIRAMAAALERTDPPATLADLGRTIEADQSKGGVWDLLRRSLEGEEDSSDLWPESTTSDDRLQVRGGGSAVRSAAAVAVAAELESLLPSLIRWAGDPEGTAWVSQLLRRYPPIGRRRLDDWLGHPDPAVRRGALLSLPFDPADREAIILRLADADESIRAAACQALGSLDDPASVPALVGRLMKGSETERRAAAAALARMPVEVLEPALGPCLAEGAPEELMVAGLTALADKPPVALAAQVLRLAQHRSPAIRQAALRVVAAMPGSRPEVLLLRALADSHPKIQVEALDLFARRPGGKHLDTLLAMLQAGDSLRYHVIRALGRLGHPRAARPLQALYAGAPLHEKLEVVAALARLGDPATKPFLVECLDSPQAEIRRVAARGIASLASDEDLPVLLRLAAEGDWLLRDEAARGLGRLGLPEARDALLDLARDLEPVVTRTARAVLQGSSAART